jgi:hypothetical protein
MGKPKTLVLSGETFNCVFLRSVPLKTAVRILIRSYEQNTITNAWKQANGKTEPTTPRKDKDRREVIEAPAEDQKD